MKPKFKILTNPLVRGTLKSLPVGNWAYEVAENIQHIKNPAKQNEPLPHSPISLLAQAVVLGLIVYAFITHQITIDDLLNWIGPGDFQNVYPNQNINPLDSLK